MKYIFVLFLDSSQTFWLQRSWLFCFRKNLVRLLKFIKSYVNIERISIYSTYIDQACGSEFKDTVPISTQIVKIDSPRQGL